MKYKKNIVILGFLLALILAVVTTGINRNQDEQFSAGVRGLPEALPSSIVPLDNGAIYNLTASMVKKNINGKEVKMLAYNGSIPGPTLKVPQGATITVNFKNETDVETALHSHGLRLENAFDGVPNVTQDPILVGDSFTYKLTFPDAGTYWYHPHLREDYAQELGLYGNFLVTPKNPTYWNTVNREIPLFVDDILIENGKIAPFYKKSANHALMGRFGNTMLVNGETNYTLNVQKNEVVRFSFTNSANVRPFRLAFNDAKMKLVGGDSGAYEKEEWVDAVTLGPSERVIVEVLFDKTGEMLIQNKNPEKTTTLGKVIVNENSTFTKNITMDTLRSNLETIESIDPFRAFFTKAIDKRISLSVNMKGGGMGSTNGGHQMPNGSMMGGNMMMPTPKGGIEWESDGEMMGNQNSDQILWTIMDEETSKTNMDIDWKFKVGDKVKIRIFNDPKSMHPMQHPIHFHGQRFLVLDKNGVLQKNLVWKDTVLVPAGEYVDVLLDISNPGEWMAHCHIGEHLEAGMMFGFTVEK